jgi:hypothetical protein
MQNILDMIKSHNREVLEYDRNINRQAFEIEKKMAKVFDFTPSDLMQDIAQPEFDSLKSYLDTEAPKLQLLVDNLGVYFTRSTTELQTRDILKIIKNDLYKIFETYNSMQLQIKQFMKTNFLTGKELNVLKDKFYPIKSSLEGILAKIEDVSQMSYNAIRRGQKDAIDMETASKAYNDIFYKYYVPIQNIISNIENSVYGVQVSLSDSDSYQEKKSAEFPNIKNANEAVKKIFKNIEYEYGTWKEKFDEYPNKALPIQMDEQNKYKKSFLEGIRALVDTNDKYIKLFKSDILKKAGDIVNKYYEEAKKIIEREDYLTKSIIDLFYGDLIDEYRTFYNRNIVNLNKKRFI